MNCQPTQESTGKVELKVNDKEVELNSFVQNFFLQTVMGMVKPLRGVSDVETISLKIDKKAK